MKNRLAKHIEQLLSKELCIVVRGLGAFIIEQKAAHWNKEELLAFPPSVALHFNERLDYHDGFLEERYAEVYGISLRRARIMIDEDVRELRQELIKEKNYTLEGLGILSLSDEAIMSFEPKLSKSFGSVAYGLKPISIPNALAREESSEKTKTDDKRYFTLRLSKRAVAWTSAAAILLIALFPNKLSDSTQESYQAALAPNTEVLGKLLKNDEPTPVIEEKKETLIAQEEEKKIAETPVEEAVELKAEKEEENSLYINAIPKRYYIIIASESTEARIKQDLELFRANTKDFTELGVLKDKKKYRLSGASFDNVQAAYNFVNKLNDKGLEAWVYKAK